MDAEGREIPLDTKCLYTCGGEKQDVLGFTYYRKEEKWEIETDSLIVNSIYLYIKPPDSWEKLEKDLFIETYEREAWCEEVTRLGRQL